MARSFDFSIIRISPDPRRGEIINIGICVYREDFLDARVLSSLRKAQCLYGDLNTSELFALPDFLNEWTRGIVGTQARYEALRDFGGVLLSEPGMFVATNETYEAELMVLMEKLVIPTSPRPRGQSARCLLGFLLR